MVSINRRGRRDVRFGRNRRRSNVRTRGMSRRRFIGGVAAGVGTMAVGVSGVVSAERGDSDHIDAGDLSHIKVYPLPAQADKPPLDVKNVQWALDNVEPDGIVELMSQDITYKDNDFNFGKEGSVYVKKSCTIKGDGLYYGPPIGDSDPDNAGANLPGTPSSTIVGGHNPIIVDNVGFDVEIIGLTFDGSTQNAIWVKQSSSVTVSGIVVSNLGIVGQQDNSAILFGSGGPIYDSWVNFPSCGDITVEHSDMDVGYYVNGQLENPLVLGPAAYTRVSGITFGYCHANATVTGNNIRNYNFNGILLEETQHDEGMELGHLVEYNIVESSQWTSEVGSTARLSNRGIYLTNDRRFPDLSGSSGVLVKASVLNNTFTISAIGNDPDPLPDPPPPTNNRSRAVQLIGPGHNKCTIADNTIYCNPGSDRVIFLAAGPDEPFGPHHCLIMNNTFFGGAPDGGIRLGSSGGPVEYNKLQGNVFGPDQYSFTGRAVRFHTNAIYNIVCETEFPKFSGKKVQDDGEKNCVAYPDGTGPCSECGL